MFRSRKPPEAVGADETQRIERAAETLGLGRPEWHPDRVRFTGRGRERSIALPALLSAFRFPDADRGDTPDLLALAGLTGVAPPPEALADLAFILLNRSQNREAAELAERASVADPTNSKAWITLGAARQALGDAPGARTAYQSCVDVGTGRYVGDCRMMLR